MDMRLYAIRAVDTNSHVLLALHVQDGEVFSAEEKQQLCEMLVLSAAQVDEMVQFAQRVYVDAAHFGKVDSHALQHRHGVDADVVAIVEKAWRKKGKGVAQQLTAKYPLDSTARSIPVLRETNWCLHLELGQSKLRGTTDPTAIFQMVLRDPEAAAAEQQDEKLDLEMSHDELRAFFRQLNAIQAQVDSRSSSGATHVNAA